MHSAVHWFRCLAIAVLLTPEAAAAVNGRLLHVALVFRHGHRSPIHLLPNDSHTVANTWRDGLGQLTNLGKMNQFELGAFLRRRYGDFLGPRYNSSQHRIRSSNIDRTLMSAQACLAGLFPPVGDQAWQPGLAWQPIPVHTVARDRDALLLPSDHANCARRIAELSEEPLHSPERRRLEAESADFLRRLSALAGAVRRPLQFGTIYQVVDTLLVMSAANLTLPAWAREPETQAWLQRLGRFSWRQFAWTPELRRMRAGVLLDGLLARMEDAAAGRQPRDGGSRLAVYSGHDVTLTPLLAALGNEDFVWPSFAACLMLELHSPQAIGARQPVVRILYRNDTRRDPLPIRVPGCDLDCPLDRLARLLAGYRISAGQFRDLCRRSADAASDVAADSAAPTVSKRGAAALTAVSYGLCGAALALVAAVLVASVYFRCLRDRLHGRDDRPAVAYHSLLGTVEN